MKAASPMTAPEIPPSRDGALPEEGASSRDLASSGEDGDLPRRIGEGDLEALKTVYDRHAGILLNHCYRLLESREAAEDVLHDLFVSLPVKIRSFRGESRLSTWLFRIVHNQCLNLLEQKGNRRRLEEKMAAEAEAEERPGVAKAVETRDLLERALAHLDPETRSLLWLKEAEGFSVKELMVVFSAGESALKSRLSRAREELRRLLPEEVLLSPRRKGETEMEGESEREIP